MATYEIQHPDGSTYQVNAPDTMSQDDVMKNFMQSVPQGNDVGAGAAAAQGFNADIPFGEKITAGLGAVGAKIYDKTIGNNVTDGQSIGDLYTQARTDQKATSDAHSGAYVGGMAVGFVPSLLAGGAAADASGLSKLNDATTVAKTGGVGNLAARLAVGAGKGGVVGSVYGAGSADNDQLSEGAEHGAEIGGMLGVASPVASDAYNYIKGTPTQKFVQDLVMPKQTAGEIADTALQRSSGGGVLNKQVYTPNDYEQQVMSTVAQSGVKRGLPLVDNLQIINNAKNAEAQKLDGALQNSNVTISNEDLSKTLDSARQTLANNPTVREHGAAAQAVFDTAQQAMDSNSKTPAGLWQARKDFDAAMLSNKPNVFGDGAATAAKSATMAVRSAMNDTLVNSVTSPSGSDVAALQGQLNDHIDEYQKLKDLETHLTNTVTGTVDFAGKNQQGFWRRQSITAAADDARNLANVKQQIASKEGDISDVENQLGNLPQQNIDVRQSLQKMNHYYTAMDNISSKVPSEPTNRIGRILASPVTKVAGAGLGLIGARSAYNGIADQLSSGGDN